MDVTEDPKQYPKVVGISVIIISLFYLVYSEFCLLAYGATMTMPLITASLPQDNIAVIIIKVLFCLNLIVTYPLNVNPTNVTIERYIFANVRPSKCKTWLENFSRLLVITGSVILALTLDTKLDKFLSILGAASCTPIAFTLPALFHYYACADTPYQKRIDLFIVGLSLVILVFCTGWALVNWND
mmetsp:Transcript_36505/g.26578  ORF Transcript_36505/g.26578 Transcript_36505/m.26578 type:complete len:185 (-) Transcript_36505:23-577(-)